MIPITNQRFAEIAGVNYDQKEVIPGKVIYCITHEVKKQWDAVAAAGDCVLITSFSDQSVTDEDAANLPDNVKMWFTTNCMVNHLRIQAIPIGFVFNSEREKIMLDVYSRGIQDKKNLMYVCFNNRHLGGRQALWDYYQNIPWATCKENVEPEEYYTDISEHCYVLSPPGAGLDCHRHWEALLMGSMPVMLKNNATDILSGIPAWRVYWWNEVKIESLCRSVYLETWDRCLSMDYWKDLINEKISQL